MDIQNFRHSGIVTRNLKKSLKFYIDILGFKIIKKVDENEKIMKEVLGLKKCKLTTIKIGINKKIYIELLHFKKINQLDSKIKIYSPGLTHISLTVNNLEKIYKKLKKFKIKFISKPTFSENKKVKLCFCRSPENIFIEFVEVIK